MCAFFLSFSSLCFCFRASQVLCTQAQERNTALYSWLCATCQKQTEAQQTKEKKTKNKNKKNLRMQH